MRLERSQLTGNTVLVMVLVIILYIIDVYMRSQVIPPAGPSRLTSDQREFRPE